MRRPGCKVVVVVVILSVIVQKNRCVRDYSKKINAEAYLYPENLWQLDYSTELEDVLENNSPTVHGDEPLKVSGRGRGYLKYKAGVSSATLSTFKSPCFIIGDTKCLPGLTYAFWARIGRVVTSSDGGSYQLLSLKAKGYGDQDPRMKVSYSIREGEIILSVVDNSTEIQSAEKVIKAGRWYHVIIEYRALGNGAKLYVYVDMESLDRSIVAGGRKVRRSQDVDLFLGKSVDDNIDAAFSNSEIYIDNLAIWKRTLNHTEKTKIYLAEFGKFKPLKLTGNTVKPFEIKWTKPYDYYSQIKSYTIEWRNGNQTVGKVDYRESSKHRRELNAFLEIYDPGTEYTVRVQADVLGSKVTDLYVEGKFIIDSDIKGSQIEASSDTPTSITLSWIMGGNHPNMSLYTISCNKSKDSVEEQSITSESLQHKLDNLVPNTMYVIEITREEINSDATYKVMYQKNVRTKSIDFYKPPTKIQLLQATDSSLTIGIILPMSVINNSQIITHVNVYVYDRNTKNDVIELASTKTQVEIMGLKQYTEYDIYAASGDGKTFGKISKIYRFLTKDIDECLNTSACGVDSDLKTCVNSNGSFNCYCKEGYDTKEENRCADIDECTNTTACGEDSELKTCVNTAGSYSCHCNAGYTKTGDRCTDIDECTNSTACGEDSELKTCVNTAGSFSCHCNVGYTKKGDRCTDVDECVNVSICGEDAGLKYCVNTAGSFNCFCKNGYEADGNKCRDIDECKNTTACGKDSKLKTCVNSEGSFNCHCNGGYIKEGDGCADIDECVNTTICGADAELKYCVNTAGSFSCYCKDGYEAEGNRCSDVDECVNTTICGELKRCVNSAGSFNCYCNKGYIKKEDSCIDVDECKSTNACGKDMELKVCVNEAGSFRCPCKDGYMARNGGCADVDECMNTTACGKDSERKKCVNTAGSFNCYCKEGYITEGDRCTVMEGLRHCPREVTRDIIWPEVFTQGIHIVRCPTGTTGNASRTCFEGVRKKLMWGKADLSGCVSQEWRQIIDLPPEEKFGLVVANKLNTFVVQEEMFGGDVTNVVDMMDSIVREGERVENNFTEAVIGLTSNLLSTNAWNDLPQEKRSKDAGLLLETVDILIEDDAKKSKKQNKKVLTHNVEMRLRPVSMENKVITVAGNAITLPEDVVGTENDPVLLGVAQYRGLSSLIGVPSNTQLKKRMNSSKYMINSEVTSVFLYPQRKKRFTRPVVIVQELSHRTENMMPHCTFWDKGENSWSDEGCKVFSGNATHVTCHCYHLTSFVILMTVSDAHSNMTEIHRLALGLITTIGIGISSVALIASLLTFIFVRTIRSLRNTIHQHLVVALFVAQLIFLFGLEMTQFRVGCQVIAAVIHYFFLVAFFVMGLEGIVLYCMLVRVYRSLGTSGYGSVKYVVWCWVFPLIFVLINLIIDDGAYNSNQNYCWLSLRNGYVWSFVGPVLLIILANFIILCLTLRVMTEKAKQRSMAVDEIWFWMKGSCLLLSILGVTWVLGIFYVDQQTVFFAYMFNIINSLQGFSIFLFHCLCDPRVRKAYKQFFCCENKKKDQLLIRTNTRSTRMFSNASRLSIKSKSLPKSTLEKEHSNGTSPPEAEVSLMSSPGTGTPNDSFAALVGATKL